MAKVILITKIFGLFETTSFNINGTEIKINSGGKRKIELTPGYYHVTAKTRFNGEDSFSFNINDNDDELKIIVKFDAKKFFFRIKVQVFKNSKLLLNEEKSDDFDEGILNKKIEKLKNLRDSNQINLEQFEELKLKAIEEQIIKNPIIENQSHFQNTNKYSFDEKESLSFIVFIWYVVVPAWAIIFIFVYLSQGKTLKAKQAFAAVVVEILLIIFAVNFT